MNAFFKNTQFFNRCFSLLVLLCLSFSAWSNSEDSLKSIALASKTYKIVYKNTDSAEFYAREAIKIGERLNHKNLIANAQNALGVVYDVRASYDTALIHYQIALDLASKNNLKSTEGAAYSNMGLTYWNMDKLELAIQYLSKAVPIFESIGKETNLAHSNNNLGLIYRSVKRPAKAIEFHKKALKTFAKIDNKFGESAALINIATAFDDLNREDSSIVYLRKAMGLKKEIGDHYGLAIAYNNFSNLYDSISVDSSIYYINLSVEQNLIIGNKKSLTSNYHNLAFKYELKGDDKKAVEMARKAIEYGKEIRAYSTIYRSYKLIARITFQLKDYKVSSEAMKYSYDYKDSFVNAKNNENVIKYQEEFESAEKERRLTEEKLKNSELERDKAESDLKRANQRKWIYILLVVALAIAFLAFFLIQKNKRRAEEEKAKSIIEEREKGIKAIVLAQEEERKRIAKDLHDGVGQQLSGLRLSLDTFANTKLQNEHRESMLKLSALAEDAAKEVRSISHQMMPKALQELGLVPAIEDMLRKSLGMSSIEYNFEHFRADKRFDTSLEISMYRVCQELINNAIKHSEAKFISVQVIATKQHLTLLVEDNGRGFDVQENKDGIGMLSMENRMNTVSGKINFELSPNGGTIATVRAKLKNAQS